MTDSLFATTRRVYRDHGIKAVGILAFKKVVSPVARVGSLYFLERDLKAPSPPFRPVAGIIAREASLSDIPFLDTVVNADLHKQQATERLRRGDLWFIAIEASTGKLANYRWASRSTSYIPELGLHLIVEPGQAYTYDLETLPEFRRRGIDAFSRQLFYHALLRKYGINRIVTYVLADNYANLKAGSPYLRSIGRVWYLRHGRSVKVFMPRSQRLPLLTSELPGCSKHAANVA